VRSKSLNGAWTFRRIGEDRWLDGEVPGGVYTDLRDAGEIPDPFYEDNELDVQWVGESDWEYRRTVDVGADLLDHDRVLLRCDGLDTVATVLVNGEEVGRSANMHVGHAFDVADALVAGENEVVVRFRSPVEYGVERAEEYPTRFPARAIPSTSPAARSSGRPSATSAGTGDPVCRPSASTGTSPSKPTPARGSPTSRPNRTTEVRTST